MTRTPAALRPPRRTLPATAGLLLALLAGLPAAPGRAAEAAAQAPKTSAEAIAAVRELAAKDEAGLTCLGVVVAASRIVQPDLDAAAVEKQVAEIAAKVRAAAAGAETAEQKVAAMNRVIYTDCGFRTDVAAGASATSGQGALDASLLHRVLERKQGVCLGLATVYLVVAERAGLPVYPVHAPCHIFCRYEEGIDTLLEERVNIECTARGISPSDEAIARKAGVTAAGRESGIYLRRATRKELLADQLNNLAYDLAAREAGPAPLSWAQLVEVIDLAVKLRPRCHEILDSAALVHFKAGNPVRALALCDQAIELCREHGAPAPILPFYRQRREELERAVQAAKEKAAEPGKRPEPAPAGR